MKKLITSLFFCVFLCGCASTKTAKVKPTFQRSWIGGHFDDVPVPDSVRTNDSHFGKHGALITVLSKNTPLDIAGLQEGDLILAINGLNVRYDQQIRAAIEKNGFSPATFTVWRHGQILDKTVIPGEERFQNANSIGFRLGLSSHFEFDLWPDPDFSLVALGWSQHKERLDLQDVKAKYLEELAVAKTPDRSGPAPLDSEEGWDFWIGPFFAHQHKVIVSQK